ncbi:hypothetical protein [Amycolatopsis sp. lyj-84]|uniref:hypothetical protein n=1 Tax=Amycolatopsis sp. lyj-84 TaxID=2789284 RepID=UPI00397C2A4E
MDKLEAELLALLGNNDVGTIDGEPVVVRDVEIRNGLDLPRLRQERPELWQQYPAKRRRERLKFPRRRTRNPDDQQRPSA